MGCLPEPVKSASHRYAMGYAHSSQNPYDVPAACPIRGETSDIEQQQDDE
jgi:hypothetical protein